VDVIVWLQSLGLGKYEAAVDAACTSAHCSNSRSIAIKPRSALRSMRPIEVTARIIFKRACALGCEGLVSKHLGSPYRAGRSDYWIKIESPAAPA
jgi:hypothetical protein